MDTQKKPVIKPSAALVNATPTHAPDSGGPNVSVAPLITMIAVLAIILIFCFCGAPAVREFCRKKVCYCCPEPQDEAGTPIERGGSSTPTIILLPFGRMLVVDRSVFAHFQADETGLDFMELSANLIRAHRLQYGASTPSILDSEATSKGVSPVSLGYSPPAYEDIVKCDLPPSYSELSLLFRQQMAQQQQPQPVAQAHTQRTRRPQTSQQRHDHSRHPLQPQRRRALDNCCVQVTASLNDVVGLGSADGGDDFTLGHNNEHITTSVLHIVDERDERASTRHQSDTNIYKKYRILSKQSSF